MSMFNEIKAVSTLTLGALNAEPGLEGLAETSTYLGQAVGFTIGVLTAPMVWELGKEQGVGIWFQTVGGLCLVNHLCLAVWQHYQTPSNNNNNNNNNSSHPRTDVKHGVLYLLLSLVFCSLSAVFQSWWFLLLWPAVDLLVR